MARHEEYDTVILGTSMIENFSERYASQKLNANVIRLPINASYITEQKYVLDIAKNTGISKLCSGLWITAL